MNQQQYTILNSKAIEFRKSLNINDIKLEYLNKPLLSTNGKLEKGKIPSFGLSLTPSNFSKTDNLNNCPKANNCLYTCIAFTGVANMMKSQNLELSNPIKAMIKRDFLLCNDRFFFIEKLKSELKLIDSTYKISAIRLNITSDLNWLKLGINPKEYSSIEFYDYTKVKSYLKQSNKHLTYSASEKDSDDDLIKLLKKGFNIAMVFDKTLPEQWQGFKVINGDLSDERFLDEKGVIVGLKQKPSIGGKSETSFTTRYKTVN